MSPKEPLCFDLNTEHLRLAVRETPWDSQILGVPVVQIESIEVLDGYLAGVDFLRYQNWRDDHGIGMVSCRLGEHRLKESMFLESHGFRFIEMVLHPRLSGLDEQEFPASGLHVLPAVKEDLDALIPIAESAFHCERFHADHRLDPRAADRRYGQWVRRSLGHAGQQLLKICEGKDCIGFFITEIDADRSAYWHLTAIAPQWQGKGYGRRTWQAMLQWLKAQGCKSVATTISARNVRVLNLYASLHFRFESPEMTFHSLRQAD